MRTLIANGTIVTADGSYPGDVLVDGEMIAQIGADLAAAGVTADETIDATGKYVIPGGIDAHTHMKLPFGGHVREGRLRDRHAGRGLRRDDHDRRLRRPVEGPDPPQRPRRLARDGRGHGRHRLRLPHDHERRQRRLAGRDGPARRRGHPGLQAVHRLPGRLLQPRRPHLPGDAADREERRPDPDARRERPGDRHRRRPARGRGQDRPVLPRHRPLPGLRGRGDQPRHPARRGGGRPRVHRPPLGDRRARRRSAPPATAARWRSPRPARSTCSCRSTTSATGSTAPSSSARRRSARRTPTGTSSGTASEATTSRSWPRTTARSTSTGRRSWAAATSARSRTACRASRTASTWCHDGGVVGGRISKERWVEIVSTTPAKMFGMYPRKGAIAVGSDADIVVYDPNRKRDDQRRHAPHGRGLQLLRGPGRSRAPRTW